MEGEIKWKWMSKVEGVVVQIGNLGWEERGNFSGRQGTDDERKVTVETDSCTGCTTWCD